MPHIPSNVGESQKSLINWLVYTRKQYHQDKTMFDTQYQILSQYFFQTNRNASINKEVVMGTGEFLNDGSITNNVGAFAAENAASALFSSVWKSESRTVQVQPDPRFEQNETNKEYFTAISRNFCSYLEHPNARFETALGTSIHEAVVYGTTGMGINRGDYISPLRFHQNSVLYFALGYDEEGNVDTIIYDRHRSAKELVDQYGFDNVPGEVQKAYTSTDVVKRFTVSTLIAPRSVFKATHGKLSMPFAKHVFMPNEQKHLEEGGFESFPIPILFFSKLEYENYGRSNGMRALPTVIQANVAAEILAEGGEAIAKPSMGLYDNGSLAGKVIDFSGGALNVFNVAGAIPTEKPVFPLYTVGDLTVIFEWLKLLDEWVSRHFQLDKLFDLPTAQRMTTKEVGIRDRNQARSQTSFNSQALRFLTQIFERCMDILFDMGLLGVENPDNVFDPKVMALLENGIKPIKIPTEVLVAMRSGQNWYKFNFISPAARLTRTDAFQSAVGYLEVIAELSQFIPSFQHTVDVAGTAKKLQELLSTDLVMINTPERVAAIEAAIQKANQEALAVERMKAEAIANQSNAQAKAANAGAIRTLSTLNQPGA